MRRWNSAAEKSKVLPARPSEQPNVPSVSSQPPQRWPPKNSGSLAKHLEEDLKLHPWWTQRGFNYSDLLPWPASNEHGFIFAIIKNELYVEVKDPDYQRCANTLWGLLELLDRFPGQVQDTMGAVRLGDFNLRADLDRPFHYSQLCITHGACPAPMNGLLWPDWTFWGNWMYNKTDWERELPELRADRTRIPWKDRKPMVYWRGAPATPHRRKALSCSKKDKYKDKLAVLLTTWADKMKLEAPEYRYALHFPGQEQWSVARKYHFAVGSTVIDPNIPSGAFWDRDFPVDLLLPIPGFWDNREASWGASNDTLCDLLVAAAEWGETHKEKAEQMARDVGTWIDDHLTMDHVYEYMLDMFAVWNKKVWRGPAVISPYMRKLTKRTFLQVLPCIPVAMRTYFMTHFPITADLARAPDANCNVYEYYENQRNIWCGVDGSGCLNPNPETNQART